MEENDVIGMEDTIIVDDQPTLDNDVTQQTEDSEINTTIVSPEKPVSAPENVHTDSNEDLYNPQTSQSENPEEKELGGDCSSLCKFNTGYSWKSSDYGYSS